MKTENGFRRKVNSGWFIAAVCLLVCFLYAPEKALPAEPHLSAEKLMLVQGQAKQLSAEGTGTAITWKSTKPKAASVDDSGKVTALKPGKAKILAEADGLSLECTVVVRKGTASDKKIRTVGGAWKKTGDIAWYLLKNGAVATGARKINGIVYVFNENGELQKSDKRHLVHLNGEVYYVAASGKAVTGWHLIGKKLYYMDNRGKMLKNQVVEGIHLTRKGYAQKSRQTEWQMQVSRTVDDVTTDEMTKEQKLRACWNYLTSKKNFDYGRGNPNLRQENWWKEAAALLLATKTGNCYHFACAFTAMAHTIGFEAYVVSGRMKDYGNYEHNADGMLGHAWCIIDGKYYDPELSFVGVWPGFYGLKEYENRPFKVLAKIRYAK